MLKMDMSSTRTSIASSFFSLRMIEGTFREKNSRLKMYFPKWGVKKK